ncbi:MFS transporter [Rhodococcus triatomae]|uniref:MFS transporter, DHA2 family, multidrug resistance protein n=1 Tax=Rhodococcus triatomae TaxID=300028 RepID=A0A1G8DSI7_9NOCA|nr:MFS transporter [Rhodococcus triatomae]QNG18355.1 MFS transporter [Rhodococcus triatomae]QNG21975.1 MFS transporter [Rhodococcus triatomae]SDH60643.1 MFS transporter, DHA2 family, multidrug resistance protein [Rhodococcus triatomae]
MSTFAPTAPSRAPGTATAGPREWFALAVLMLPVLLVSVDNTVLAFALPSISAALGPSGSQQLWIIDIYPLVLAGLLVSMGSMGDRFGRRRLLLLGATGFAAVSVFAAYAPSAEMLIASRAALGFFGAMLMPSTLSLLRNIFVDATQRRLAIAVWAACFAAGAALGPIVGGFLLEHYWWGSVFLLAVPVLIPLLILAPIFVPESRDPNPGRIDPVSIALSLTALAPLVFAIKNVAKDGSAASIVVPAVVGLVATALFVRRQLRRPDPMLDVRLFTVPTFSGAVVVNLLSVFSLVGFLFFVSQHLQLVIGQRPMQAGLSLVPGLLVMVVAGLSVVPLVRRIAPVTIVVTALLLSALGYVAVLVFATPDAVAPILVAFAVLGAGIGAAETISNDLIVSSVPPQKAGAASAVSETAYELGAVLGTAVLGTILTASYRSHLVVPDGIGTEAAEAAGETLGGAHHVAETLPPELGAALLESAGSAFDTGVGVTSGIGAALMVVAAGLAFVTLRTRRTMP